mmetsp:Transcript_51053/g.169126  ORF Transcript_51053/g.169126 Transcript_51053/m.169126 type:complete len:215 (-) Transcript_51053:50-694(-)
MRCRCTPHPRPRRGRVEPCTAVVPCPVAPGGGRAPRQAETGRGLGLGVGLPRRQSASRPHLGDLAADLGGHRLLEEGPVAREHARQHREARRAEHDAVESHLQLLVDRRRPKRLELAVEGEQARRRRGLGGGREGRAVTQRPLVRAPAAGPLQRSRAGGGEICDAGGAQQLQRLPRQQRQQVQRRQRLGHLSRAQRVAVSPLVPRVDSGGLSRR